MTTVDALVCELITNTKYKLFTFRKLWEEYKQLVSDPSIIATQHNNSNIFIFELLCFWYF